MADFCGSLQQVATIHTLGMPQWQQLLTAGRYLGASTIVNAELAAIELGIKSALKALGVYERI